jgi:NADH:ubiquinone reductase (non-electrogenic)
LGIALNNLGMNKEDAIVPFNYKFLGQMSYVGGDKAVGDIMGKWKITGNIFVYSSFSVIGFGTWWLWRANIWYKQFSVRNRVYIALDWFKTILFGRDISKF